jgi:hypothetical protein
MNLIGAWVVDETDVRALADFGDLLMEFGGAGQGLKDLLRTTANLAHQEASAPKLPKAPTRNQLA